MSRTPDNILITGSGFAARALVKRLVPEMHATQSGLIVVGRNPDGLSKIHKAHPTVAIHEADLTNPEAISALVDEYKPGHVIHLAAFPAPTSVDGKDVTVDNNNRATRNLLTAVKKNVPESPIVVTTSSLVYKGDGELTEGDPLLLIDDPNPYVKSKLKDIELIGEFDDLTIVEARVFTHVGPESKGFLGRKARELLSWTSIRSVGAFECKHFKS